MPGMTNTISQSTITISTLAENDWVILNAYVERMPAATFFHYAEWSAVIEKALGHRTYFIYAKLGGHIVGLLPLVHLKSRLFGNMLSSTPFCVCGGIVADNQDVEKKLYEHADRLAAQLNVDYLELRNIEPIDNLKIKDLYVTFRKKLANNDEDNLKEIPRKQRAVVRKGIKVGLEGKLEDDLSNFYRIYSESVRNLGTPVLPEKYFQLLSEIFADKCRILTIYNQTEAVASVMSFYFRNEVLPYYGGGTKEARYCHANDFMYWDLMCKSVREGIEVFDYGRSKVASGSYRFKKHWGFKPEALHYQYSLHNSKTIPNISPTNPKYSFFIKVWKKLPLPVANLVGPKIARNLG